LSLLDFDRRLGLLMLQVLPFIPDEDDPRRHRGDVPGGPARRAFTWHWHTA